MLLLLYKSASCWRKLRKTGDGKCDVHSSHGATASVSEQPTLPVHQTWSMCEALSGHLWWAARIQGYWDGKAAVPRCLLPSPCPLPSPKLLAGHWYEQQFPAWMLPLTHTHKQAHSYARSYIFISSSVAGCLSGLLQSLTEQTGFSELRHVLPALLDYYANTTPSLWYLLNFQHAPDSLVSISNSLPLSPLHCHNGLLSACHTGGQEKMAVMGGGTQALSEPSRSYSLFTWSTTWGVKQIPGCPSTKIISVHFQLSCQQHSHIVPEKPASRIFICPHRLQTALWHIFFLSFNGEVKYSLWPTDKNASRRIPSWTMFTF